MKDFLGNILEVGDEVICIELHYKNLKEATVVRVTLQTVTVEYNKHGRREEVKRYSEQVVRI
jgi:hypothetical protein